MALPSKEIKQVPKNNTKKDSKKGFGMSKNLVKVLLITFLLGVFIIVGVTLGAVIGFIKASDSITPDDLVLKGLTTNLLDNKQEFLINLQGDKNREMVDIKITPKYLRNGFIAIEDKRFYEHPGIDLRRIAGAAVNFFLSGNDTYGASTITQQVVRNLSNQFERSVKRKVQEQWKALELERHLTKDQILEIYMNIIYMGHNCYGVQSASKLYFGKSVSDLSLPECAVIAGITNAPSIYDPFTQKGRDNIKKRQEIILGEMLKSESITKEEYDAAIPAVLKYTNSKTPNLPTPVQPYYVDQIVLDVKKGLIEKGFSEDMAIKMIYNNGLKIYTTIDSDIQKSMDSVFTDDSNFIPIQNGLKPEASMVILDTKNGQVRALYGGAGVKTGSVFNRATSVQMKRQPGSTFKPLAVYGPAIDSRTITAATVFDDTPLHLDKTTTKRYPENYDNTYSGLVAVRDALKQSLNIIAARIWTIEDKFPNIAFRYLKDVNLNREKENYLSTALGGLNEGVNPLQLASAYVPFASEGSYFPPITYTKVVDSKGKVLLENTVEPKFIYDPDSAFVMTSLLSEVTTAGGTAEIYGKVLDGRMPSAGKTGTTSDNKDKWFVGFTPYYIGATWYGYDTPTSLVSTEYERAQKIWQQVMNKVHRNLAPIDFKEPSGIVRKKICRYSGKVPSSLCSQDPRGAIREEVFIKGTEPSDNDVCDVHVSAKVCTISKDGYGRHQLFGPGCPESAAANVVLIKRTKPYIPKEADDPYPMDYKYEKPNKYCVVHNQVMYDDKPPEFTNTQTQKESKTNNENSNSTPISSIDDETGTSTQAPSPSPTVSGRKRLR